MNPDFAYCTGSGCGIREHCLRYAEGRRLPEGSWWWMQHCDAGHRDGYLPVSPY